MNQRRLMFLMLCLFGYVLLMAGWWITTRNPRQFPGVRLRLQPFIGASAEFSSQLEQALRRSPGVELAPDGAVLSGMVEGTVNVQAKAQLKNPVTGSIFWHKDYSATPSEPRPVPKDIAHDAAEAVRVYLAR